MKEAGEQFEQFSIGDDPMCVQRQISASPSPFLFCLFLSLFLLLFSLPLSLFFFFFWVADVLSHRQPDRTGKLFHMISK